MSEQTTVSARLLMSWGIKPGPTFRAAIAAAQAVEAAGGDTAAQRTAALAESRRQIAAERGSA